MSGPQHDLPEGFKHVGYLDDAGIDIVRVLHEFHTRASFASGPHIPGNLQLLSNGFARFTSDNGKMVVMVRKEALDLEGETDGS